MSYSYVKTVFPNFEFSNVYNDKLYTPTIPSKPLNVIGLDYTQNNEQTYKQIESYQDPLQDKTRFGLEHFEEEPYKNN